MPRQRTKKKKNCFSNRLAHPIYTINLFKTKLKFSIPKMCGVSLVRSSQDYRNLENISNSSMAEKQSERERQRNPKECPLAAENHNNITASDTDGMSEPRWDVGWLWRPYEVESSIIWHCTSNEMIHCNISHTHTHTCSALSHAQCNRHDINTIRYTVTLNIIYL